MPYKTPTKFTFDPGEFQRVMDQCMKAADWQGFTARHATSERNDRPRGIGMATYTERCGGAIPETASIEFKGERIELVMGNQEIGTELPTAYRQIISEQLGVDADCIDVVMGDTDRTPSASRADRTAVRSPARLFEASQKGHRKRSAGAAHLLETASVDVVFEDAEFKVVGTDLRMGLFAVAQAARDPRTELGLDVTHFGCPRRKPFLTAFISSASRSIPDTGNVTVDRYTVVDDFGRPSIR